MDITEILLGVVACCFLASLILLWLTQIKYRSLLMDYKNLLDKHHEMSVEYLKFSRQMVDHFKGNIKPFPRNENSSQLPLFADLAGIGIVLHQKSMERHVAGRNLNDVQPKQADGDDKRND